MFKEERRGSSGGFWVTLHGAHIFIKDGETTAEAIERTRKINEEWDNTHLSVGKVQDCRTEEVGNAFRKALVEAKSTQPQEKAWRVDTDSHDGKDYVGTKTYVSDGGSTFSVTESGNIISVCINTNDSMKGYELIEKAVKAGGKKLDSFSGNFAYYMRNGFEPVSWTVFDKKYKPGGWVEGRDREEPVIFFKYTGKKYGKQTADFWESKEELFYRNVKMSGSYDEAMAKRDREV